MKLPAEWPIYLPGYEFIEDKNCKPQEILPKGIVAHSGAIGAGMLRAALRMGISYNFPWCPKRLNYVQTVRLDMESFHGGWRANHWLSLALPGPYDQYPRSEIQRLRTIELCTAIHEATGGYVRYYARHSSFEPRRKDPGPGFLDSWMEGTGLVLGDPTLELGA